MAGSQSFASTAFAEITVGSVFNWLVVFRVLHNDRTMTQVPSCGNDEDEEGAYDFCTTFIPFPIIMPRISSSTSFRTGAGRKLPYTKSKPTSQLAKPALTILRTDMSGEPIYFYKPDEPYGFLGQWYLCPMTDPESGITFNCCEQYMMYHKALTFSDTTIANKVLAESNPRKHKGLGKRVSGFTAAGWDPVKFDIVVKGNMLKFGSGKASVDDGFVFAGERGENDVTLKDLLMATGERELVEASIFDRIWGIGYSASGAEKIGRESWGTNLLGKALMEVRTRLRESETGTTGAA